MKKIFCAVLALAAMASCSNEDTIEYNKQAIAFGEAFVNNATRADYSSGKKVETFQVWGTVQGKHTGAAPVYIFDGAEVSRPDGLENYDKTEAWDCTAAAQYWVPNANYAFTAVVDGALNNDHATIPFTVADGVGNLDLLYATATAGVDEDGDVDLNPANADGFVTFNFSHLLSKLQFTVTNGLDTGYSIQVTGITVTGVAEEGIYTVSGEGTWAKKPESANTSLTFGETVEIIPGANAVASQTRQILPVEQTLGVTIAYDIIFGGQVISKTSKNGTINAMTYVKSTVYNIATTITNENQIKFTVGTVGDWSDPDPDPGLNI